MPPVPKKGEEEEKDKPLGAGGGLSLPKTSLGAVPNENQEKKQSPAQEQTEEAVIEQTGLLAEFEKISDQLKELLGSLEASTFVKRLKPLLASKWRSPLISTIP